MGVLDLDIERKVRERVEAMGEDYEPKRHVTSDPPDPEGSSDSSTSSEAPKSEPGARRPRRFKPKTCARCDREFTPRGPRQLYCGRDDCAAPEGDAEPEAHGAERHAMQRPELVTADTIAGFGVRVEQALDRLGVPRGGRFEIRRI